MPELERFWSRVLKTDNCWLWTGAKTGNGYGAFSLGSEKAAHRASYLLNVGEIPPGQSVCHKCDNPICVRPDHLFLGTTKDNQVDAARKGRKSRGDHHWTRMFPERVRSGAHHPRAKLSSEQVNDIRRLFADGLSKAELSRRFKLSDTHVGFIVRRMSWR